MDSINIKQEKLSFDLGRAFPVLTRYLTTSDKLSLAATCHLLRDIVLQSHCWHQFSVNDFETDFWTSYKAWIGKYIDIIQPSHLFVFLKQEHQNDKELLKIFLKQRDYIKKVQLRCETALMHLAIVHSCPRITSLTLHSQIASNQLLQAMVKNCQQIKELQINADSLQFTGQKMAQYLKHPLERLVLKPYQLDYEAILIFLRDKELNQLSELQIDMEECGEPLFGKILKELPHIQRLRLYHMEKFTDQTMIIQCLNSEIVELSLTKCYHLELDSIIETVVSSRLENIDLTEALHLKDQQLTLLANKADNLRHLNVSWCNQISNASLKLIVDRCLKLQGLVVNGIKSLNDESFSDFVALKPFFNEKLYDEIRFEYKKRAKHNKRSMDYLYQQLEPKASELMQKGIQINELKTLRNLRYLECNSCNNISDTLLKVIYCSNRMARVINYYGQVLSLYYISELSEDQFF